MDIESKKWIEEQKVLIDKERRKLEESISQKNALEMKKYIQNLSRDLKLFKEQMYREINGSMDIIENQKQEIKRLKENVEDNLKNTLNGLTLFSFIIVISVTVLLAIFQLIYPVRFFEKIGQGQWGWLPPLLTTLVVMGVIICLCCFAYWSFNNLVEKLSNLWTKKDAKGDKKK